MTRQLPEWMLSMSPALLRAAGYATPKTKRRTRRKPKTVKGPRVVLCATNRLTYAKERRAELRKAKRCINGWGHGKATHGCRCKSCYEVHRGRGATRTELTGAADSVRLQGDPDNAQDNPRPLRPVAPQPSDRQARSTLPRRPG